MSKTDQKKSLLEQQDGQKQEKKTSQQKVINYVGYWLFFQKFSASSVTSQVIKYILNILIDLSFVVFVIAVAIAMISNSQNVDIILEYIKRQQSEKYLIAIGIMSLIIYKSYTIFKGNSQIQPKYRKKLNFVIDFLRIINFTTLVLFVKQYVDIHNDNRGIQFSYILFIIALVAFGLRKIFKWVHYTCGSGKQNMKPWINKFVIDDIMMKKYNQQMTELFEKLKKIIKK